MYLKCLKTPIDLVAFINEISHRSDRSETLPPNSSTTQIPTSVVHDLTGVLKIPSQYLRFFLEIYDPVPGLTYYKN